MNFNDLSTVFIDGIQYNHIKHSITFRNTTIALTKTEYRLFSLLKYGQPITYVEIAHSMYNCNLDPQVREMIDKHVDRLRRKLRNIGLYIYCILNYGYLLLDVDSSPPKKSGRDMADMTPC